MISSVSEGGTGEKADELIGMGTREREGKLKERKIKAEFSSIQSLGSSPVSWSSRTRPRQSRLDYSSAIASRPKGGATRLLVLK